MMLMFRCMGGLLGVVVMYVLFAWSSFIPLYCLGGLLGFEICRGCKVSVKVKRRK